VKAGLDHLVDEADPVRLLGVDGPAGEDHLQGAAHAHDPRQALGSTVDQRHAPAPLEEAEGRASGGDPHVAPERQLDPSGQTPTLDRRDRRLRWSEAGRAHRPVWVGDVEVHRLEVGAGAEGLPPGSGEDENASALVGLEVAQSLTEELGGRRVDRVAPLGAIDGQHRGGADPLVAKLPAHRPILSERERAG
jgi:hypothetical protein